MALPWGERGAEPGARGSGRPCTRAHALPPSPHGLHATLTQPLRFPLRRAVPQIVCNWHLFVCVASGLWGGLLIGLQTEYFTSNRYQPVQARPRGVGVGRG